MFGPSLKSVPGCLVSIVPILIGVPVALTPGLGPQDDVDALPPADALVEALLLPEGAALLLLLLPPQAASPNSAMTAVSATKSRLRGTCWYVLTRLSSPQVLNPPRLPRSADRSWAQRCMQPVANETTRKPLFGGPTVELHATRMGPITRDTA
jgi:hypothetical protein